MALVVWLALACYVLGIESLRNLQSPQENRMPKTPSSEPSFSPACDPRLPAAAFAYRTSNNLLSQTDLGAINITAWLCRDKQGVEAVQVNPNVTIAQLKQHYGSAASPDAELGFHSEGIAAEWFRTHPQLKVLQIFTERYPCAKTCAPLLKHYYPGVAWYYYYKPSSWTNDRGQFIARASKILKSAYGLP